MPRACHPFQRLAHALLAACAAATLGWTAAPAAQAPYDEEFPHKNAWARVTPAVTWCNDSSGKVTLEVHIVGRSDVVQVEVTNGGEDDRVVLYDDGTNGDPVAGDRVFTRSEVLLRCFAANLMYGRTVGRWVGMLRVTLSNGRTAGNNFGISAGVVHPAYKGTFQVKDYGEGLSATSYAFFIEDRLHEVLPSYPVSPVTCGTENFEAFRKLYSVLPDEFDFALVTPGLQIYRPDGLGENVPYSVHVSNAIAYIGLPPQNNTAAFGSAGRLKSIVYHSFGSIQIVDHELAHTWGASIGQSLGLIEPGPGGIHWNEMSDVGGQLGAYYFAESGQIGRFTDNGDGTWHLRSNHEVDRYSPLELYLMGLIPSEEVPPMHVLTNPDLSDAGHITAASVRTITIQDVIAAEGGSRSPGVADSQKAFSLAYIVLQDQPYNDAAYAYFSLLSYSLMRAGGPEGNDRLAPFYWATGGRATLDTRLPVDVPDPEGLPDLGLPGPTPAPTDVAGDPVAPPPTPPDSATSADTPQPATLLTVESGAKVAPGAGRCAILPALVLGAGVVGGAARKRGCH